jgi:hypothetical protein
MNVPNPFKLLDELLLDYVFNPFTWWSEATFGKDAMAISGIVSWLGMICFVISGFLETSSNFYWVPAVFSLFILHLAYLKTCRDRWCKNNKTGKNILRINEFWWRMCYGALTAIFFVGVTGAARDTACIIVWMIGVFFWLFISPYLDATDAMPPGYRQRQVIPQTN